jgi:hypothetical protein
MARTNASKFTLFYQIFMKNLRFFTKILYFILISINLNLLQKNNKKIIKKIIIKVIIF